MDFSKYRNRAEIQAVEDELKSISPELRIVSISLSRDEEGAEVIGAECSFIEKGSSKIVKALLDVGWVRGAGRVVAGKRYIKMRYSLGK